MEKLCSICKRSVDSESAAILTLGGFGNPKYLCDGCDADMADVTRGADAETVEAAMERIGKKMSAANIDDALTLKTVKEIMESAAERKEAIRRGEYDFESEKELDATEEAVPEELLESDEDKEADRIESEKNAKFDKIINAVSAVVFAGVLGFIIYKIIEIYFLN